MICNITNYFSCYRTREAIWNSLRNFDAIRLILYILRDGILKLEFEVE